MNDEQEKAIKGSNTLSLFCRQFGEDVHAMILLEVLLEGIMNDESLFVFGEPQQERNEINHGSQRRIDDNFQIK